MIFRQFKSEKGMTLVELLAALGLFAVVIVLSSSVILQLVNSEEKTSEKISLTQEMNVLISELRSNYQEGQPKLCLNESADKFAISNVENGENEDIEIDGRCIKNYQENIPLSIQISTNDAFGRDFSIQTTLISKEDYVIDWQTNKEKWVITVDDKFANCYYEGNTRFRGQNGNNNKVMFKNNECPNNTYVVNGSAWITGEIKINNHKVTLEIANNLYITEDAVISANDKGKICVRGRTFFPPNMDKDDYKHIFTCSNK